MESKKRGSFEGWNKVWKDQSSEEYLNPMYTEVRPTTIYQFWQRGYADHLMDLIKDRGYATFCELGAGRGTTSMYLSKHGYTDITMVDLAEEGFKVADYSFEKFNLTKPKMVLSNVEKTDFRDNSFDCIYNIGLLEHFEDPSRTLKESFRLLRPKGLIFMPIVPDMPFRKSLGQRIKYNPVSIAKYVVKKILGERRKDNNGILRTDHNREYYIQICKELGFLNVRCIPYNPFWMVASPETEAGKKMLNNYIDHYDESRKKGNNAFETKASNELCYLLTCEK